MNGKRFSDYERKIVVPENMAKLLFENACCDNSYYMYYEDFKNCVADATFKRMSGQIVDNDIQEDADIPFFIYTSEGAYVGVRRISLSELRGKIFNNSYGYAQFQNYSTPSTITFVTQNQYYLISDQCDDIGNINNVTFASGKYTIAKDGIYNFDFNISVICNNASYLSEVFEVAIYKNDVLLKEGVVFQANLEVSTFSFMGNANLLENDYVDARIKCLSNNNIPLDIAHIGFRVNEIK